MQVGPYELLERLGAGGMAETHVAIRRGPGGFEQRVCLKRILPGMTEDPELVRLFHEEARVSARLGHANVAQVLDFGVAEDGGPYLVLELIEGSNLRALLREDPEPLTSGLVAYLATELGQALDYAHGERVVHRDLSPSNVLLSRAGEVKLGDFGIAKALSAERTRTGVVKGKVPYMAPEYAREGSFEPRSDLFALGVILYEALAGARPYDGANEPETIAKAARGERVPLAERVPEAPAALRDAIERLIEPELEARPESARAFLEALAFVKVLHVDWRRDTREEREPSRRMAYDGVLLSHSYDTPVRRWCEVARSRLKNVTYMNDGGGIGPTFNAEQTRAIIDRAASFPHLTQLQLSDCEPVAACASIAAHVRAGRFTRLECLDMDETCTNHNGPCLW
ncbi:MAG TPA: serine/threonine-protein kinase, partial [Polyangiaceae bacterium LLY-WYZ-15_(1-7)]|nr:serine/threonine-protein kinase [Polyangiaceae bacterium LLY-WYZ-15_(1-7)]